MTAAVAIEPGQVGENAGVNLGRPTPPGFAQSFRSRWEAVLGAMGNGAAGVEASAEDKNLLTDERGSTQATEEPIPGEQAASSASSSSGASNLTAFTSIATTPSLQEAAAGQVKSAPQRAIAILPADSRARQASDPLPRATADPAAPRWSGRAAQSAQPQQSSQQRSEPKDRKLAHPDDLSQAAVTALAVTPVPPAQPGAAEVALRAGTIGSAESGSSIPAFPTGHVAPALMEHAGATAPAPPRPPTIDAKNESAIAPEGTGAGIAINVDRATAEEPIAAVSEPASQGLAEKQPENSFSPAPISPQSRSAPGTSLNLENNPTPNDSLGDAGLTEPISAPAEADSEQSGTAQPSDWRTASRVVRGSSAVETTAADPQASATGATPHAMPIPTRDQAAALLSNEPAAISIGSAAPTAPHDPFSALDSPASAAPTWVHAGAQRAEAGFEDPSLGWVGVRAGLGEGGVHAALVPASPDAAASLGTHLAGLSAYLAQHHTAVSAVTLATPESHSQDSGYGSGTQHAPQQGSGDGAQADAEHNANQNSTLAATTNGLRTTAAEAETAGQQVEAVSGSIATTASMAGTRISVMA